MTGVTGCYREEAKLGSQLLRGLEVGVREIIMRMAAVPATGLECASVGKPGCKLCIEATMIWRVAR